MNKNIERALASIPRVEDDFELKQIDQKIQSFEELLKKKRHELSETRNYPSSGSLMIVDVERDALQLIDGIGIDELAGPNIENRKANLKRQIEAITKAMGFLKVRRRDAESRAIQAACVSLPEPVTQIFKNMRQAGRDLCTAIEVAEKVNELLSNYGLPPERRPMSLNVSPYFAHLLHGGGQLAGGSGLASLRFILDNLEGEK